MVLVDRGAVDRSELSDAVRRQWPDVTVTDLTDEEPSAAMTGEAAVELAALRRGAEPLRIVVMPQRDLTVRQRRMIEIEPMPVVL